MKISNLATVPVEQQVSVQVAPAVETPEFKAWFGKSKVVDEAGKPRVVYHGTNAVFREFNPARQGERDDGFFGNGFYFAEQRESAESYAAGYGEFEGADPPDEIVMETYLVLENPFTVDVTSDEALADTIARAQQVLPRIEFDRYGLKGGRTRDWTKALKAAGYDGVIVKQGSTGLENEFVAFEPTQIKSATSNDGSFDANEMAMSNQATGNSARQPLESFMAPTFRIFVRTAEGSEFQAFTWCRDEASGIARAWREGREFGHNVAAVWAEAV